MFIPAQGTRFALQGDRTSSLSSLVRAASAGAAAGDRARLGRADQAQLDFDSEASSPSNILTPQYYRW